MSNRSIVESLDNEFSSISDDARLLVAFAFPKADRAIPKPDREPNAWETVDIAWSICGLLSAAGNMITKKSGSVLMHGWSVDLPGTASELLEKLNEANKRRVKSFASLVDDDLQRTFRDSEGEETAFGDQLITLLTGGSRLLGRLYAHLQKTSDTPPPLV